MRWKRNVPFTLDLRQGNIKSPRDTKQNGDRAGNRRPGLPDAKSLIKALQNIHLVPASPGITQCGNPCEHMSTVKGARFSTA